MTSTAIPPSSENPVGARLAVKRTFGEPRFHTDGELLALAFAPDGTVWSVEDPGELRQWNPRTGQPIQKHMLSDLETLWVFSRDARLLASASDDLSLWDTASGKQLATISQPSWVTTATFRPDSAVIATGHDDGMVRLWDVAQRKLLSEFKAHAQPVSALAFSPDGLRLASAGEDRAIVLWDAAGKEIARLLGHTDRIPSLAWHPKGHRLVSAGWDTTARVWDTATDEPVILLNSHADQVSALAFSPDGSILACADSASTIHIWHTVAWKTLQVLSEEDEEIRCLAFSPDGKTLASGGADRVIHLWDPQRGQLVSGSNSAARHSICVVNSRAGQRLASTSGGSSLQIWDVATARSLVSEEVAGVVSVQSTPDGQWIAAGGTDEKTRIRLFDAATGKLHSAMSGQRGTATALAAAPNSPILASASATDGTVWLWNAATGEPVLLIIEAADGCTVESLAFHPQGRLLACGGIDWLATGGSDGAICIWDVLQPAKVAVFERGTTSLAFHPSGKWLAAASLEDTIYLWDTETAELAWELSGDKQGVGCIAFSPDGRWLASGGDDRVLRLWEVDSREPLALEELDTPVKALCFSPDSRFLFTANGNTTSHQLEVAKLLEG
jgi:WD40 repeat protein